MQLVDDLWAFSLAVYARPDVAPRCLALQDQRGANVNILLWLLWLESRGHLADPALIARAEVELAEWETHLLQPLRQLRRELRTRFALERAAVAASYQKLKAAELQAERVEQEMLAALIEPQQGIKALPVGTNLGVYLHHLKVPLSEQQALLNLFQ